LQLLCLLPHRLRRRRLLRRLRHPPPPRPRPRPRWRLLRLLPRLRRRSWLPRGQRLLLLLRLWALPRLLRQRLLLLRLLLRWIRVLLLLRRLLPRPRLGRWRTCLISLAEGMGQGLSGGLSLVGQ
jgi:hypothetical protein